MTLNTAATVLYSGTSLQWTRREHKFCPLQKVFLLSQVCSRENQCKYNIAKSVTSCLCIQIGCLLLRESTRGDSTVILHSTQTAYLTGNREVLVTVQLTDELAPTQVGLKYRSPYNHAHTVNYIYTQNYVLLPHYPALLQGLPQSPITTNSTKKLS